MPTILRRESAAVPPNRSKWIASYETVQETLASRDGARAACSTAQFRSYVGRARVTT